MSPSGFEDSLPSYALVGKGYSSSFVKRVHEAGNAEIQSDESFLGVLRRFRGRVARVREGEKISVNAEDDVK